MSEKHLHKSKKSKKDSRRDEIRDDGLKKSVVNYSALSDKRIDDKRHEREKEYKAMLQEKGMSALKEKQPAVSMTFDAFQRMAAGLEGRTLADKISDPNRPTWEQYKKDNEDKLDMVGQEVRKMVEYRAQLDKERERLLDETAKKSKTLHVVDSDEEEVEDDDDINVSSSKKRKDHSSDDSDSGHEEKKKKKKKEKKANKKEKKHKKHKHAKDDGPDSSS